MFCCVVLQFIFGIKNFVLYHLAVSSTKRQGNDFHLLLKRTKAQLSVGASKILLSTQANNEPDNSMSIHLKQHCRELGLLDAGQQTVMLCIIDMWMPVMDMIYNVFNRFECFWDFSSFSCMCWLFLTLDKPDPFLCLYCGLHSWSPKPVSIEQHCPFKKPSVGHHN